MPPLPWLHRDGRLLFAGAGVRNFAYGLLAVTLGPYLKLLGVSPLQVGVVFTAALAGTALYTLLVSLLGDLLGRRRTLLLLGLVGAGGGLLFPFLSILPLLAAAAFLGALGVHGRDRGALMALEQAVLPGTAPAERRTLLFAHYNLVGTLAGSMGALASGALPSLGATLLPGTVAAYRGALLLCGALLLLNALLYLRLSPAVEERQALRRPSLWPRRSRKRLLGLAGLFGVDGFGGGFIIPGFLSYWFFTRWGLGQEALGAVFFASTLLNALSYPAAAALARRLGLLNTMVFPHLLSQLLLVALPLAPTGFLAVVVFLLREFLSQMDVPTRQSYTMAVVALEERTAAAGLTSLSRQVGQAAGPSLAGHLLGPVLSPLPFFMAGGIKAGYDLALFLLFRGVHPPEEVGREALREAPHP